MKLDSSLEIFRPEIEGKVAIVTGGSTGIGSETAKTLAALGAEVHFCGRNVEAGKAIEALFPAGNAHFAKVDVTKPKELERWIKKLPVVSEGRVVGSLSRRNIISALEVVEQRLG